MPTPPPWPVFRQNFLFSFIYALYSLLSIKIRYGLVARICRSHLQSQFTVQCRQGPGSIPGVGSTFVLLFCMTLVDWKVVERSLLGQGGQKLIFAELTHPKPPPHQWTYLTNHSQDRGHMTLTFRHLTLLCRKTIFLPFFQTEKER